MPGTGLISRLCWHPLLSSFLGCRTCLSWGHLGCSGLWRLYRLFHRWESWLELCSVLWLSWATSCCLISTSSSSSPSLVSTCGKESSITDAGRHLTQLTVIGRLSKVTFKYAEVCTLVKLHVDLCLNYSFQMRMESWNSMRSMLQFLWQETATFLHSTSAFQTLTQLGLPTLPCSNAQL